MLKDQNLSECKRTCSSLIAENCDEVYNNIDRHYQHYEIPVGAKALPMLTIAGAAILFAWKEWFAPATVVAAFGGHWGNMAARFIMVLFAMWIWPIVINKECGRMA